MRDGSFYDKLSDLNDSLYNDLRKDYKDFKFIEEYHDNSGIFIEIFKKQDEYFFVIKGTEFDRLSQIGLDNKANLAMISGIKPVQYNSAKNYFNSMKDKYKPLIITGYSLGGALAQVLGYEYGNETICFEPFAGGTFVKNSSCSNVINFGNIYDLVFMQFPDKHIGQIYIIPMKLQERGIETHKPFHHGKPSTAKPLKDTLESNFSYYLRKNRQKIKDISHYLRKGLLPSMSDRIKELKR